MRWSFRNGIGRWAMMPAVVGGVVGGAAAWAVIVQTDQDAIVAILGVILLGVLLGRAITVAIFPGGTSTGGHRLRRFVTGLGLTIASFGVLTAIGWTGSAAALDDANDVGTVWWAQLLAAQGVVAWLSGAVTWAASGTDMGRTGAAFGMAVGGALIAPAMISFGAIVFILGPVLFPAAVAQAALPVYAIDALWDDDDHAPRATLLQPGDGLGEFRTHHRGSDAPSLDGDTSAP